MENTGNIGQRRKCRVRATKQLNQLGWICLHFYCCSASGIIGKSPYAIILKMHKAYSVQSILNRGVQIDAIAAYGELNYIVTIRNKIASFT